MMALCRWSQCDLYIYEAREGIMCHVAARRYAGVDSAVTDSDELALVPIGLLYDGQHRVFGTWDELLEYVTQLKETGYDVPDWLVEEIREEVVEEVSGR